MNRFKVRHDCVITSRGTCLDQLNIKHKLRNKSFQRNDNDSRSRGEGSCTRDLKQGSTVKQGETQALSKPENIESILKSQQTISLRSLPYWICSLFNKDISTPLVPRPKQCLFSIIESSLLRATRKAVAHEGMGFPKAMRRPKYGTNDQKTFAHHKKIT